jgi:hypothetical protein
MPMAQGPGHERVTNTLLVELALGIEDVFTETAKNVVCELIGPEEIRDRLVHPDIELDLPVFDIGVPNEVDAVHPTEDVFRLEGKAHVRFFVACPGLSVSGDQELDYVINHPIAALSASPRSRHCVVFLYYDQRGDWLLRCEPKVESRVVARVLDIVFRRQREEPPIPLCPDHKVEMQLRGKLGRPSRFSDMTQETYTLIYFCPVPGCDNAAEVEQDRSQIPVPGAAPDRPSYSRRPSV